MGEEYHYDKLAFLNRAYHHTLPVPVASQAQPTMQDIISPLYPHQVSLVAAMHQHRQRMTIGYLVGDQAINGNMGILADRAGTGKTLSILAYLASLPVGPTLLHRATLTPHSLAHFYSHTVTPIPQPPPRSHLVIVPHALFSSWRAQIAQHTTLRVFTVETRRHLRNPELMRDARIVLTTSQCYKAVQQVATEIGLHWDCIFIDEASSIHFHPSDPPLSFQFLWLVSSNWIPLMMQTAVITKSTLYHLRNRLTDLHPDLERWLIDSVTSRYEGQLVASNFFQSLLPFHHPQRTELLLHHSSAAFMELLPRPRTEHLQCRPNITLHSLMSFYLSRNMDPQIRTSQIPHLFRALHVEWKDIQGYIETLPDVKRIRAMRSIQDSECVICFEPCRYPTILSCCHHVYCGKCVLQQMMLNPRCPMCREAITPRHLTCLESPMPPQTAEQQSKIEACLRLFREHPAGMFMVYSSFDNVFFQMAEEMDKVGLRAERLDSRLFALQKTVRNVQQGRTNIMFISNAEWIRGMSFPSITHLIFYHEPSVHEWKELLLYSVQRLGRTAPLTVVHLHSEIQV